MRHIAAYLLLLLVANATHAAEPRGATDVPWVGRYEGSTIITYEDRAFDETRLLSRPLAAPQAQSEDYIRVQGRRTRLVYQGPEGRSSLEIFRNFQQRLAASGFEQVWACELEQCTPAPGYVVSAAFGPEVNGTMSFSSGFYKAPRYALFRSRQSEPVRLVAVYVGESPNYPPRIAVLAAQQAAMQEDKVIVPSARQMSTALQSEDRIALYGIYFATDQATLTAESQPTLEQIIALMRAEPALKLLVVGHTDSTGDLAANVMLSQRRADAVVAALVRQGGIAAGRLMAFGVGMAAPAASNAEAAGRTRNRRVELVRR